MISLSEFANTVLQKTRNERLEWKELARGSYLAAIGQGAVIIEQMGPALGPFTFMMRITNMQGVELERITPKDAGSTGADILEEIYERARRQALRVDETLVNIKRSLDAL